LKENNREDSQLSDCLSYEKDNYSYSDLYNKINSLPNFQFKKITDGKKLIAVLKGFVLQDRLLKLAREKKYDTLSVVKKKIQRMKMNLFMQYKGIEILRKIEVPDSLTRLYYDEHKKFFTAHDSINVQEIIVSRKELADSLLKKIKSGEDFGKLAAAYSIRKETAINNGVVGFVSSAKFVNFEKIFKESRKNDLIGPIEFSDSWGIFKVLEIKKGYLLPYDDVKEDAALLAKHAYQRKFIDDYTDGLMKYADVEVNKKLLGSLRIRSLNK
jgi:parvulin-like peptidyl-prolyl isomerase